MSKLKTPKDMGMGLVRSLDYDREYYYCTFKVVYWNVVNSLNFDVAPKFERLDVPTLLLALYEHKHDRLLNGLCEKIKGGYIPQDEDFAQDSSISYLAAILPMCSPNTVKVANRILVANGIIEMWSVKKDNVFLSNKVVLNTTLLQKYLDEFAKNPQKFENWIENQSIRSQILGGGLVISDQRGWSLMTNGLVTNDQRGTSLMTNGLVTNDQRGTSLMTNGLVTNDYISKNKKGEEIKILEKDSVSDTPQKNQFLNLNQNNPINQIEKKPIVNLVNYSSQTAFADELAEHLMDNRKAMKELVLGFNSAYIVQYAEKHAAIVFKPQYEGLRNIRSYDAHVAKMGEMGVFSEVNGVVAKPAQNGIGKPAQREVSKWTEYGDDEILSWELDGLGNPVRWKGEDLYHLENMRKKAVRKYRARIIESFKTA
jgi:hypothetical protein